MTDGTFPVGEVIQFEDYTPKERESLKAHFDQIGFGSETEPKAWDYHLFVEKPQVVVAIKPDGTMHIGPGLTAEQALFELCRITCTLQKADFPEKLTGVVYEKPYG